MTKQRTALMYGEHTARATKRQYKHDLLVTFMANATTPQRKQKPASAKPGILRSLLSIFL